MFLLEEGISGNSSVCKNPLIDMSWFSFFELEFKILEIYLFAIFFEIKLLVLVFYEFVYYSSRGLNPISNLILLSEVISLP